MVNEVLSLRSLRYRLSRLVWATIRCRLRFLTDRRRRFMNFSEPKAGP